MKKTYIKPETLEVTMRTEGMIAMSMGGTTDVVWTNKREPAQSFWETEDVEEETSGIW